ncbi:MAG: DUF2183 domain-containing protein [Bdellovibrionaceae bacterium]|nr:DUF2183 domain-containing protein [Pseudobdellovibrionaceae bacterium]
MRKWIFSVALLILLIARLAGAAPETIVVSDIDDTIRKTQIQSRGAFFSHLINLMTHQAFTGMPTLYSFLAGNGATFHYVSGAPEMIRWFPQKFLLGTSFPAGPLSLRPSLSAVTLDFKVATIEKLLREKPEARFVLIGDNGEYDVEVYERLKQNPEFAGRVMHTYIHKLYRSGPAADLRSGQQAYITSAELALDLLKEQLITAAQAEVVLRQVEASLASTSAGIRRRALPEFAAFTSKELIEFYDRRHEQTTPELRELVVKIAKLKNGFLAPGDGIRDVFFHDQRRLCRQVHY